MLRVNLPLPSIVSNRVLHHVRDKYTRVIMLNIQMAEVVATLSKLNFCEKHAFYLLPIARLHFMINICEIWKSTDTFFFCTFLRVLNWFSFYTLASIKWTAAMAGLDLIASYQYNSLVESNVTSIFDFYNF